MPDAVIKFDGREALIDRDVTTIGRVSENIVAFPSDSNVSRYHAEIERRGGDHWLIDLKSSNGTTVNGEPVDGERRLQAGDKLCFGGTSNAEFVEAGQASADAASAIESTPPHVNMPGTSAANSELGGLGNEAEYAAESAVQQAVQDAVSGSTGSSAAGTAAASTVSSSSSSGPTVLIAGAVVGLAVVCAAGAGAFYLTRTPSCAAEARIVSPESGDTIDSAVEIKLDTKNAGCVQQAVFTIDGRKLASAEGPDFAATLDPKDFPELADGTDHALKLELIDSTGAVLPQTDSVLLAFETRAVAKSAPSPAPSRSGSGPAPARQNGRTPPSIVQMNDMAQKLVRQLAGRSVYNVSNKQFLAEVQKRTPEYAVDGYSQRAAAYREVISVAFVREQNIDAPLGFILAMSRSKFDPAKQGDREGLWQLPAAFITDNKYNGQCGSESLSDPTQNCAARSAALYFKAIVWGVFGGDPIYSAAAFGKSPQDAAAWNASLPANRSDVWNTIRTADEREQLVRFFAAGIVAENPQVFGLTKDRPLSELYSVTLQQ